MDIEQAYDKIYRFVYFKMHNKHLAEDITQETFLKYINSKKHTGNYEMRYLYTIAKNLCVDEFRKVPMEPLPEDYGLTTVYDSTKSLATHYDVQDVLAKMSEEDRELLLLRFANEESINTICKYYQCSRFVIYRRIKKATAEFKRLYGGNDL